LNAAALVLIDHQREYLSGPLHLTGIAEAVAEMAELLALARDAGMPVFHVVHHGRKGGALFDPDGPRVEIIAEVAPRDGEAVIIKSLPNAFAATGLHAMVQAAGRRELVLAGFATHMCISATARAALDLGYRTTLVAAAMATRDLPDPLGGVIAATVVHRAELAALADRFAIVVANTQAFF
jgi:nicotinamidase-related amidase